MKRGFTLIELIVVIIIVGILAALGLTQYSSIVEKSRLTEAKIRIGVMRQLAYEYYLNNGTLTGLGSADNIGANNTCEASNFYRYFPANEWGTWVNLVACRSTNCGKLPRPARGYVFYLEFWPGGGGVSTWRCVYTDDQSPCFGYPGAGSSTGIYPGSC